MYRNVFVVALFALVASIQGASGNEQLKRLVDNCAETTGVDIHNHESHMKNGVVDHKWKCFDTCMGIAFGILKKDGTANTEDLIEHVPKGMPDSTKLIEDLKKCGKLKHADKCEVGHKVERCFDDAKISHRMNALIKAKKA